MVEQVGLVDDDDGDTAAFGVSGGQGVGGLRDESGVVDQGLPESQRPRCTARTGRPCQTRLCRPMVDLASSSRRIKRPSPVPK